MAKFKLKNTAILELFQTLTNITGAKNTNFNFVKAQNKASLKRFAEPVAEVQVQLQEILKAYNAEHKALLEKYAEKDKNGQPKIKEQRGHFSVYDISPENIKKIDSELLKLREGKFKKDIAKYEKEYKNFEKILNEEHEVEIVKFKQKDLPDDLDDVFDVLLPYIEMKADKE